MYIQGTESNELAHTIQHGSRSHKSTFSTAPAAHQVPRKLTLLSCLIIVSPFFFSPPSSSHHCVLTCWGTLRQFWILATASSTYLLFNYWLLCIFWLVTSSKTWFSDIFPILQVRYFSFCGLQKLSVLAVIFTYFCIVLNLCIDFDLWTWDISEFMYVSFSFFGLRFIVFRV